MIPDNDSTDTTELRYELTHDISILKLSYIHITHVGDDAEMFTSIQAVGGVLDYKISHTGKHQAGDKRVLFVAT